MTSLNAKNFQAIKTQFFQAHIQTLSSNADVLIPPSLCPILRVNPSLWLPKTHAERSRIIRWRLGWVHSGEPEECILHPAHNWNRRHVFDCLNGHCRLYIPVLIDDPLLFLLKQLPLTKPRPTVYHNWFILWPILCTILYGLDFYFNDECPPKITDPGDRWSCQLSAVVI